MYGYLKKIKPKHYPWLAFLLTCVTYLTALSYMGLLSNGKYIIARSDLFQQFLPFMKLLEAVWEGKSSWWFSWNVNMGGNTALLHAYYTLSPFNLIFLLLGEAHVMQACAFVIVLKAGLAAVTCQIFLRRVLKQEGIETVLFAMMYALCGFQVSYYFILSWMDAVYMFPVILLCIAKLIKDGKKGGLIASLAYLFFVNFYMGYIAGLCSFFLFAAGLVYTGGRKGFRFCLKRLLQFFWCVLAAAALTCVVWYPAALDLLGNPSVYMEEFQNTYCNPLFIYNNLFMGQMQSLEGVAPFLYCGLPVLLLLPGYFLNKQISRRERLYTAAVILWFVLCMTVLPLNRVMHAFDDPNMFRYRYAYCLSFVLLTAGCRQSRFIKSMSGRTVLAAAAAGGVVYAVSAFLYPRVYVRDFSANSVWNLGINVLFIAAWILAAAQYRSRKMDYVSFFTLAAILLMAELGINAGMMMKRMEHKPLEKIAYQPWHDMTEDAIDRIREEDGGWYRINAVHMLCKNTGIWFDYQGTGTFSSSLGSRSFEEGMKKLGFYVTDVVRCHAGKTPVSDLLLGIKYQVDLGSMNECITDGESQKVVLDYEKKDRFLSIGYMVTDKLLSYQSEISPFANQNHLLSDMTGEEIRCFEESGNATLEIDNGEYEEDEVFHFLKRKDEEEDSVFHFSIPKKEGREAYAYFSQPSGKYHYGDAELRTNSPENENIMVELTLVPSRIVKLGTKDGECALDMMLSEDTDSVSFIDAYFTYYNEAELDKAYDILKKNQMTDIVLEKNGLSGTVEAEKGREILFTSIPWEEGWRVLVDGREEELLPLAESAFIGVRLTPGQHRVEFLFEAPGVREGVLVTLLTAFLLIIWIWRGIPLSNKSNKGRNKNETRNETKR